MVLQPGRARDLAGSSGPVGEEARILIGSRLALVRPPPGLYGAIGCVVTQRGPSRRCRSIAQDFRLGRALILDLHLLP